MLSSLACYVIFLRRIGRVPRETVPDSSSARTRAVSPGQKLWHWVLAPILTWALVFGVMWLVLQMTSGFTFTRILDLLVISLIMSATFLWALRAVLRADWRGDYILSVQRDAGVVVGEFPFRKPKLWVWIAVPSCMALTWLLVWLAPVRFEHLVIAGGFALFGLVKHGQDRRAFGLVHFLSFTPYWGYAVACAAGLPQPFADSALRINIPLFLLMVPVAVVCELYSRGQLRRLQRILKDEGQRARDAGD